MFVNPYIVNYVATFRLDFYDFNKRQECQFIITKDEHSLRSPNRVKSSIYGFI